MKVPLQLNPALILFIKKIYEISNIDSLMSSATLHFYYDRTDIIGIELEWNGYYIVNFGITDFEAIKFGFSNLQYANFSMPLPELKKCFNTSQDNSITIYTDDPNYDLYPKIFLYYEAAQCCFLKNKISSKQGLLELVKICDRDIWKYVKIAVLKTESTYNSNEQYAAHVHPERLKILLEFFESDSIDTTISILKPVVMKYYNVYSNGNLILKQGNTFIYTQSMITLYEFYNESESLQL